MKRTMLKIMTMGFALALLCPISGRADWYQRNGKWRYSQNGRDLSNIWIYDKDLAQVTKQSFNSQFGDTPALLLSGNPNQISHSFKISQPNDQKNFYVLTPKTSSANFRDLSIAFNGGKPVMIVLNDNIGQTTTIKFTNININKKIAANQFSFIVPSGVEVINQ